MADPKNATPKKKWWEWLLKDVLISGAVAATLDYALKNLGPKALDKLSDLLGAHITKKYIEDKRSELLDDFRKMETADTPIKLDNLWRRHKKAIANLSEDRFVILLLKTIADQEDPKKGRQAALRYLNDMTDARFNQALFMLDQDNHVQAFQRWRDRAARITKSMSKIRRRFAKDLQKNFGALGNWIVTTMETIEDSLTRFFNWLSQSAAWTFVAVMLVMILLLVMTRFFRGKEGRSFASRPRSDHGFLIVFATCIVLGIVGWEFCVLVQPTPGALLLFAMLMSIAALIAFWRFIVPRRLLFLLIAGLFAIWFINRVQHADTLMEKVQAAVAQEQQRERNTQQQKPSPVQPVVIETLLAPARPDPSAAQPEPPPPTPEVLYSKSSGGTMASTEVITPKGHCATEDGTSPIYPYGYYQVILQHCFVAGTQIMVSGLIEWRGDGPSHPSFHAFKISDPAGKTYEVQTGKLGTSEGFGQGYFSKTLESKTTIAFSFTAGTVDPKAPPIALDITFPNTQGDFGDGGIRFTGVTEMKD
ncbi:MAG TPA: hypothetical protein VIJ29_04530 [Candidatus Paceibacterota bacterium]